MKMVCVTCQVEFKSEQNGIWLAEMFLKNEKIYKLWHADLWKCPGCEKEIVAGLSNQPVSEHFQEDLEERVRLLKEKGERVIYDFEWRKNDTV